MGDRGGPAEAAERAELAAAVAAEMEHTRQGEVWSAAAGAR